MADRVWKAILAAMVVAASAACGGEGDGTNGEAGAPTGLNANSAASNARQTTTTKAAPLSKTHATVEMSGALTFSFEGPGGKCSTVRKEDFSKDAGDLALDMTGYEFRDPEGSFDLTFMDEENDGSIDIVILNGRGENAHWSLAKGSGTAQGRTDLKGVSFDVQLGSIFNAHPPVLLKGSIDCT